jgi:hypothetical protein
MAKEKMYVQEVNCETGEVTVREFTEEQYAQAAIDEADYLARKAAEEAEAQAKAEARASALAKLAEIGLTEDEVKAIVSV